MQPEVNATFISKGPNSEECAALRRTASERGLSEEVCGRSALCGLLGGEEEASGAHLQAQGALVYLEGQVHPSLQVTLEVHVAPVAPGTPLVLKGTYKNKGSGTEQRQAVTV